MEKKIKTLFRWKPGGTKYRNCQLISGKFELENGFHCTKHCCGVYEQNSIVKSVPVIDCIAKTGIGLSQLMGCVRLSVVVTH